MDSTFSNPEYYDGNPKLITAQVHQNNGSMEINEQPLAESARKETQPLVGILTTRPQLTKRVRRMTGYLEMKPVKTSPISAKLKAPPPPPVLTPLLDK